MWIYTDTEMPEEGAWVIFASDKKGIAVGYYADEWVCFTPLRPLGKIIKWQPLPDFEDK